MARFCLILRQPCLQEFFYSCCTLTLFIRKTLARLTRATNEGLRGTKVALQYSGWMCAQAAGTERYFVRLLPAAGVFVLF